MSLEEYLEKSRELDELKARNEGEESPEEDELLEQMDELWWGLTEEEKTRAETNENHDLGPETDASEQS